MQQYTFLTILVILMWSVTSHGMRIEDMPTKEELFGIRYLLKELQNRIVMSQTESSLRDDILFLCQQPITLKHKNIDCILSLKIIGDKLETRTIYSGVSIKKKQYMWDLRTGDLIKKSKDPYKGMCDIYLYKESVNDHMVVSHQIVSCSKFSIPGVYIYDAHTKERLHAYTQCDFRDAALDGAMVVVAVGQQIFIHDKNECQRRLDTFYTICAVALHNNIVMAGLPNGDVHLVDVHAGKSLGLYNTGVNHITAVALRDKQTVVGSYDGTINIADDKDHKWYTYGKPHNKHTKSVKLIDMNDDVIVTAACDSTVKIWPALRKDHAKGRSKDNPFVWIICRADDMQLNFICRACAATEAEKELIIDLPKKFNEIAQDETSEQLDGRIYFTFPEHVRDYLRKRLTIRKPNMIQQMYQSVQKQTHKIKEDNCILM